MGFDDSGRLNRPDRLDRRPSIGDYEDFARMTLAPSDLAALVGDRGECVFNWSTQEGYPVGVVMAYIYRHDSFWTNCSAQRKRVAALRARPQAAVVVNHDAKMATYKGDAVIHSGSDEDWVEVKRWFYAAMADTAQYPDNPGARAFEDFLDGPHQVIIEMPANLVVSFDFGKFSAITQAAIGVPVGQE